MILGHESVRDQLMVALKQNKLHHAYLLDGPKGVGKASFVSSMLPQVLGGESHKSLLESGAHPDFMKLEIEVDSKTGKLKRDITRDQVEKLLQFLIKHTSLADRKVVLIDAADDLNVNAANNLLKWLEEPRPSTCIFLVAHRVDRLLPTIRSRCARLRFSPLSENQFRQFAKDERLSDADTLYAVSGGVPGQALQLANPKIMEIKAVLTRLIKTTFEVDPMALVSMAKSLMISIDNEGLETSLRLLRHSLREFAEEGADQEKAKFAADAYAKTLNQEAQAKSLNIDPLQVLATLLLDLKDLARQGQAHV